MNTNDFRAGDTVRLKRPYARGLTKRSAGAKIDWTKRRGIVQGIRVRGTVCAVMWPGCITPDPVPIAAIEKCQP